METHFRYKERRLLDVLDGIEGLRDEEVGATTSSDPSPDRTAAPMLVR